jgi:hypothetical protein
MPHITTKAIHLSQGRLRLTRPLRAGEAPTLRSFFGCEFADEVHRHCHNPDGSLIYQYPRVQFKVIGRTALLIGVAEGSELLQRLWTDIDETICGDEDVRVREAEFETHKHTFEVTTERIEYRFVTPWLALNEKNFHEYTGTRNQRTRKDELARIVVGNCLGIAKSLDIRFTDRITADCRKLTSIKTSLKGRGMIGFVGKFSVNLEIPEYLGLGKSVSRGFGTVAADGNPAN